VAEWLTERDAFGLRSYEKRVPEQVFAQPLRAITVFLRHLWATDGCIWIAKDGDQANIYYATSSHQLATDVQDLLTRLGINARVSRHAGKRGRPQYHVTVSGAPDQLAFVKRVGGLGEQRVRASSELAELLIGRSSNTNRDVIPRDAWRGIVEPARVRAGITQRALQAGIGTRYCGSALYKTGISRARASRAAIAAQSPELMRLAVSDIYWDQIASIEEDGDEEVFDLTVDGLHNFVANNIVVHNSIEQDADVVGFLYRDDYYNKESEDPGGAELILSKHRNGPIGTVNMVFLEHYPKFADRARSEERPVEQPPGEGPPIEDSVAESDPFAEEG
jgi:replicative DNA helicase